MACTPFLMLANYDDDVEAQVISTACLVVAESHENRHETKRFIRVGY